MVDLRRTRREKGAPWEATAIAPTATRAALFRKVRSGLPWSGREGILEKSEA